MTERKPTDVPFESWVERQIRTAQERGEFDDLPGAGKPLGPLGGDDELWWVRSRIDSEGLSRDALLPPGLALRREIERLPDLVADLDDERSVADTVRALNRRITEYLRAPTPPIVPLHLVDADDALDRWRTARAERRSRTARTIRMRAPAPPSPHPAPTPPRPARRRRFPWPGRRTTPDPTRDEPSGG